MSSFFSLTTDWILLFFPDICSPPKGTHSQIHYWYITELIGMYQTNEKTIQNLCKSSEYIKVEAELSRISLVKRVD
jgi:hypothetical protein